MLLICLACSEQSDSPASADRAPSDTAAPSRAAVEPRRGPPNLIVITLDTTRADALGVYGQIRPITPAVDRMARSGVLFENAVASSPMTLPSHATIFSGKFPYAHGVRSNGGYVLSKQHDLLAETLRSRGYRTGAEVAAEVLRSETQLDQGFEQYRGSSSPDAKLKVVGVKGAAHTRVLQIRPGSDITTRGIEFIRKHRNRSFFLWLHYFDAHQPYALSDEAKRLSPDSAYHAAVADQDRFVGRVLDEIERLGLREETLVILTADHGEGLREHGEETHSYFVYDSTMRVPLVFWGLEGVAKGVRQEALVRTVDIMPTALDLLGLPVPAEIQGVSVASMVTGGPGPDDLVAYGESFEAASYFGTAPLRFVREGRWKYIHKVNPELFDVLEDPGERVNLAEQRPDLVEKLRGRLESLLAAAPAKPEGLTTEIDARTRAQLEALGYASHGIAQIADDELASLELSGEDPNSKVRALEALTKARTMVELGRYDAALAQLPGIIETMPGRPLPLLLLAQSHAGMEQYAEAAAAYGRVLEVDACEELALSESNRILRILRQYDVLVERLGAAADACPDLAGNLNNYAWALATLPRDDLRDGEAAVEAAEASLALLAKRDPGFLDTLAAALAESGRFEEALAVQAEALARLEGAGLPEQVASQLETHMRAYREGRPVRSPAGAGQ